MKTWEDASDTACDTSATDALILDFGIVIYYHFLNLVIWATIIAHFYYVQGHNKFCSYTHFRLNFDSVPALQLTFDVAKPMPVPRSPNLSVAAATSNSSK
jgi:hypothetical protein